VGDLHDRFTNAFPSGRADSSDHVYNRTGVKRLAYLSLLLIALATGSWLAGRAGEDEVPVIAADRDRARAPVPAPENIVGARAAQDESEHRTLAVVPLSSAPSSIAEAPAAGILAVLDVRILWADAPIAGADVELLALEDESDLLIHEEPAGVIQQASTGADGIARFAGLHARRYGLIAGVHGARARTAVALLPGRDSASVVIALGDAGLEGTVFGVDGGFAPRARVLARQDPRATRSMVWFSSTTDAAGNYRIDGLAGGAGQTVRAMVWEMPLGESLPIELGPGERRKLDFGSPRGSARWSGCVRLGSGELVPGPLRIFFVPVETALVESTGVGAGSRFDVRLPSATYIARLGEPRGLVLGRAAVSGSIVQDLILPGSVLRGSIEYVGTKHPLARGPEHDVILTLEREDGTQVKSGFVRRDRSYAFLGLEPGKYVLSTAPWILSANAEHRALVEIAAGEEAVELALEITDP
jgi:hypothetical protein